MASGIIHRWDDERGEPAFWIDDDGHVSFGAQNEAILTRDGGIAIWLINKTGSASVRGKLVTPGVNPSSVQAVTAGVPNAIGAFLDSGVADGQPARVVISGVAWVLFADGQAPTVGYWVGSSDAVAGRARAQALPPGSGLPDEVAAHNAEIGHCIDTVAAGTDVLARVVLHFN
jgi:hypothetical protein